MIAQAAEEAVGATVERKVAAAATRATVDRSGADGGAVVVTAVAWV